MHLSAHDQQQITALLGTARSEILSLVPSCEAPLCDAYFRTPTRSRIVVSRSRRAPCPSRDGASEVRLGRRFSTFLLIVDRKRALAKNGDVPLGRSVVQPAELDRLIALFDDHWDRSLPVPRGPARLTELQLDILRQLATGLTDQATANALKISSRTVQRQVSQAMDQLGARSRLELGVYLAATELI
ncbi:LuxR C-terminal-related transcriptional regulator [Spirillospora sp. NPDC048911]|uniref:helix-turn-helix transcriptional regulator n=1 Tax=Spirillospora sp. NPDC048911 TaxID=3364527 RepID=UPI003712B40A